ncbi:Ferritin-like domain-containing protein [Hymenobacter daecheongensis DSM 21074]|uniref:Ferritin-like domain-containing protein n=1 Tax=Hymenobacter daecheongensis DSM 21074 TaxID=1121955 RepID=A0A1M6CZ11_9BACT|nr:ferritin-like domain-containing protein [Hymenobacter daecheongensis]SHI66190.1 Ferritin-like domain-containing protein [Hymenobacter daecheongensis DSM 21074]
MNIFRIIEQLSEVDADVLGRFDSRRAVFKTLGTTAKRGALASAPVFLASLFQKAYGQGTKPTVIEVLNYAQTLELLEEDFYKKMVAAGQVPAGAPKGAIDLILKHETAHVKLLDTTIRALGGTPVTGVKFKTSAFPADYTTQLVVAQALEDTGVRAYKGQAGNLMGAMAGTTSLLQVALQIHSVEARHAAHIRTMRMQTPWIPAADSALAAPLGPVYTGAIPESNTTQSNVDITKLGAGYTANDAAASFDEILTMAEVLDASRAGGLVQP